MMLLQAIHRLSTRCFALLLLAGTATALLHTAEATTALNGFNLEEDAQGTVRIQLDTPHPIAVEEQRQQGVYKLILKNTVISDKMKREGLPVVMDTQGKYIARATQLPNNQVSITIPNGVELHHQVQVVGGAATPPENTRPESAVTVESPPSTPYFTPTRSAKKLSKVVLHHAPVARKVVRAVSRASHTAAVQQGGTPPSKHASYVRLTPAHPTMVATHTPAQASTLSSTGAPAIATPSVVSSSMHENATPIATSTTTAPSAVGSIMLASVEAPPTPFETLPTALVFDTQWLANRFNTAETAPVSPLEIPWMPLLNIGVGTALAVGLGVWAKKSGLPQQWLGKQPQPLEPLHVELASLHQPETALFTPKAIYTPTAGVELLPIAASTTAHALEDTNEAVIQASQNILDSLFINRLKEQATRTPETPAVPESATVSTVPITPPPPATVPPSAMVPEASTSILMPTVVPPSQPSVSPFSAAQTGSGLQATLVQAIKKSEAPPARTVKAPAMLVVTGTPKKQDFKAITQRLGNKKFLGVY
jgi:hypothetical protein